MATTTYKPGEVLAELRAIRDRLSLKLLTMTPAEQAAYLEEHSAWFEKMRTAKKVGPSKRAKPAVKRRRPNTKQRA